MKSYKLVRIRGGKRRIQKILNRWADEGYVYKDIVNIRGFIFISSYFIFEEPSRGV